MPVATAMHHDSGTSPEGSGGRLSARVYAQLKERLLEGGFEPGRRVSIEALKTEFGVSKQPIMEAFRLLSGDGLVDIQPQIGCRPTAYTQEETFDFFRVFAGYEGAVAEAAAGRRTEAQLRELGRVAAETEGLEGIGDQAERGRLYRHSNRRFHEAVHSMAHSRVISMLSRRMWDLSDYLVNTSPVGSFGDALGDRHVEHQDIVAALRAGDGVAARELMSTHILHTVDLMRGDSRD